MVGCVWLHNSIVCVGGVGLPRVRKLRGASASRRTDGQYDPGAVLVPSRTDRLWATSADVGANAWLDACGCTIASCASAALACHVCASCEERAPAGARMVSTTLVPCSFPPGRTVCGRPRLMSGRTHGWMRVAAQ